MKEIEKNNNEIYNIDKIYEYMHSKQISSLKEWINHVNNSITKLNSKIKILFLLQIINVILTYLVFYIIINWNFMFLVYVLQLIILIKLYWIIRLYKKISLYLK